MAVQIDDLDADLDDLEALDPTLQSIVDNRKLKWIFVGGKGGVGKTTTSCSIGALLSKVRKSVLIISTDPAHNLSDAFSQKFGTKPTKVNGFSNLFCMEIDPMASKIAMQEAMAAADTSGADPNSQAGFAGLQSIIQDLSGSIPGIDEAMSFAELMRSVQSMTYEVIVFDTAPTGHTLRLLSFPKTLESTFSKFMGVKDRLGGMFAGMLNAMGAAGPNSGAMMGKLQQTMEVVKAVNKQFKNPESTTFVCVCIPEFLSVYETERLVQELAKFEIDTHCIVVNQVLPENAGLPTLRARQNMQRKYLEQIYDLYEDFNIVEMPLLHHEVRGAKAIANFSQFLLNPFECSGEDETQEEYDRLIGFLASSEDGQRLLQDYKQAKANAQEAKASA